MRTFKLIFLYIFSVAFLGALLSPLVYNFVQALSIDTNLVVWLQEQDFARYFRRTVMVVALILIIPFLAKLGVNWADIGLSAETGRSRRFFGGVLVGIVSIFCLGLVYFFTGAREWRVDPNLTYLIRFVFTAIIVAGLEEVFFRGIILSRLRKTMSFWVALITSSLFFAAIHFLRPGPDFGSVEVSWYSGFALIPQSFSAFADPSAIASQFSALFLAGLILGYAFLKKQSLYFSIGLHAGWVYALKSMGLLTDNARALNPLIYGGGLYDGLYGIAMLVVVLVGLIVYESRHKSPADS
ncbi:CPBP family intramembrane metalloprotease [Kamptonema cortianum]|nr:CPBP family intramembrane metalloprotease [Kamptonema cortianum]MDL5044530.1 CPBP family intramembrane metalloprotease [Oscillatoria amoena NRMC-F 0135]